VAVASDASAADELPDPADRTGNRKLRLCREVLLDTSDVQGAGVVTNTARGKSEIVVHFTAAGAERFRHITRTNLQRQLAIVLNGRVLSAPFIQVEIDSGQCRIAGAFSPAEAAQIAEALRAALAPDGAPPSATLPNGVTVKLVGLTQYPTKGKSWWLPNGQACPTPLFDGSDLDIRSVHPSLQGDHTVVFACAITGLKSGTGSEVQIASPESTLSAGRQFKNGAAQPEIKALALNVPTDAAVAHLRLTFDAEERLRLEYETTATPSPRFDPVRLPKGEQGAAFCNVSLRPGIRTQPSAVVLGSEWPPKRS